MTVGCAGSDPLPAGNNSNNTNNQTCATPPCSDNNAMCMDNDGDGFGLGCARGTDCDDANAARAPDRAEACDGLDNDCNGIPDDGIDCAACTDIDQDGYGEGCTPGPDCDDENDLVNEGASERCDTIDNDCDDEEDEDFEAELGMPCTAGMGECETEGVVVCSGDGLSTACGAMPPAGSAEVCDRLDNDCNGAVDDGVNCPACVEDAFEPNDSSPDGTDLTSGSKDGYLCPNNVDWFRLGNVVAGQQVTVNLTHVHADGDIDVEFFIGSTYEGGAYTENDNELFTMTASKNGNAAVRLIFDGNDTPPVAGTVYTISR